VTITNGAALEPDDDASPDAEDGDTGTSRETGRSTETGISHVFVPHVIGGISLTVAPDVVSEGLSTDSPDLGGNGSLGTALNVGPAEQSLPAQPNDHAAPEIDSPLLSVIALSTTETPPPEARVPLSERARAALRFTGPGLTGLGGAVLGCLVVGLGAAGDLALGHGLGAGFSATFLFGCVLVACALRTRALALAIVLPPLLFAGGYALETKTSGQTTGTREMALDVATSLALHAPLLFIGTAIAVAIAVVRVAAHIVRR
jgi:Domain of unknown function (DUF6542)